MAISFGILTYYITVNLGRYTEILKPLIHLLEIYLCYIYWKNSLHFSVSVFLWYLASYFGTFSKYLPNDLTEIHNHLIDFLKYTKVFSS